MTFLSTFSSWRRGSTVALLVSVVFLPSCETAKESLGFHQVPPDEFVITSNAPLVIPEEKVLQKPRPGMHRPQEIPPRDKAFQALFQGEKMYSKSSSPLEGVVVKKVKPSEQVSNVRRVVDQEADEEADLNIIESAFERFHQNKETIDPKKEAQRLKKARKVKS